MKDFVALLASLLLVYAVAAVGGLATSSSVTSWYPGLEKPSWTPPAAVFGPVWTLLYTLLGVAAWLVWRRRASAPLRLPLLLYAAQLALNLAWSLLFFGLRQPGWSMLDLAALWLAAAATAVAFWRVSRPAGVLLVPYLLWLTFAGALNLSLWQLNRPGPG